MRREYPDSIWQILACPRCRQPLDRDGDRARCTGCRSQYGPAASGALDLRFAGSRVIETHVQIGEGLPVADVDFTPLVPHEHPEVDFTGVDLPRSLSPAMRSHFPRARTHGARMLDLGCGVPVYRPLAERAGFEYLGIDIEAPEAPLLGNLLALPFQDESVDLIWSASVLQYVPYPAAMMAEAYRVLKPGGSFLGTAGFLEPFDGHSFCMYTGLGLLQLLRGAGFHVRRIAPDTWWTGLVAMGRMGLFPRMPHPLSRSLVLPLDGLSRLWWRVGRRYAGNAPEAKRLARVTGGHQFVAVKD